MPFRPLESEQAQHGFHPLPSEIADGEADTDDTVKSAGARGFRPLASGRGFTPLDGPGEDQQTTPSARTLLLENPAAAIAETGANLASQAVALPAAGLAGLATVAGNAVGLTDREPADVVHSVGDRLTYQPRGEMGKAATAAVMAPFEKLAELGRDAGSEVLERTGSPAAATVVDTAINALPMAISPAARAVKGIRTAGERPVGAETTGATLSPETQADVPMAGPRDGLVPSAQDIQAALEPDAVLRAGSVDEAIGVASRTLASIPSEAAARLHGVLEDVAPMLDRPAAKSFPEEPRRVEPPLRETSDLPSTDEVTSVRDGMANMEPDAGPWRVQRNASGNLIISASDAEAGALEPVLRDVVGQSGIGLTKIIDHDGGLSLRVPKTADEALVSQVVADINRRAIEEGWKRPDEALPETGVLRDVKVFVPDTRARAREAGTPSIEPRPDGTVRVHGYPPEDVRAVAAALGVNAITGKTMSVFARGTDAARVEALLGKRQGEAAPTISALRPAADTGGGFVPLEVEAGRTDVSGNSRTPGVMKDVEAGASAMAVPVEAAADDVRSGHYARAREEGEVLNGTWNPGANHVGFVDQVRPPASGARSVADLPAPLRREQIIKDFADALGAHVYGGRVKGKNRLGFFRKGVEEVRTKHAADIEVAAHELAHLIDARVPEIQRAYIKDKALRDELRSVSYDQKSVKEGFAEAVRLWTTQPETLEAKAPKVHAWLEEFANTHQYGPALRKVQVDMAAWFGQDALNRARSKIGTERPLAEFFDRFWDKFRQSTVDDLHGIYRMEQDLTGKVSPSGAYESARLSRASASIADGAVRFGYPVKLPDGSHKFMGKGLDDILKPVSKNLDDALLYFVGRSARELMDQGREHLFTKGEIDAMLRLRTAERDKAFAEYQAWNKGILDFAEAQGVINPESRRLWQRTQYLPFHRVEQPGGLKGKPGDWSGIQALTGGTTNIKDVLGNMVGNAAMLIDKGVKNEARTKVARLAELAGSGRFMVKIDAGERPVSVGGDQVLNALLKRYGIAIDGDAPAFFEFLLKGQPPAGNNVVAVLRDGKPVWWEVGDPLLYRALQAIDRPVQSDVVRWLGLPKRIGQATITATPDFWMGNIARDTLMGSVMSRAGFRPVLDSLQGMRLRMTSDPVYRDYLANGGGLSSIFLDEQKLRTKLERFYRDQGIDYRTVLDAPDKLLTAMETLGDAFEMSTRLGEYRRAVERGENPRHAAYMGREVSTDFAMRGDSKALGFMYDTVMFLRPAVVSWDRLYRGLAHDPNKGAIAAKAGTMALASAALYLLNRDDPRYADLPDWDRDANWHFFVGDQHFRWPKIWEIGAMSSAAERTVEKIMAEDPAGLGKDFARILGATFNLNLMPQIAAPLYEQATNRNSFTKAPIETPGMESVQPFLRAKPGTSETMKALGMATRDLPEGLQVNPARAEALLRGYFNTYALYGLMLSDVALFGDQLPEKRADEFPVVRRFYSQEPAKHTRYESEFYDLLSEAKRLRGTMRELDEMGYRSYADEKEKSPLAGEAKPLDRAAKNLSAINNEMQAVRRDESLSPTDKRQRLDALTVERNALVKAAVIDSKGAQKEKAK
jgi:hypothetical protein